MLDNTTKINPDPSVSNNGANSKNESTSRAPTPSSGLLTKSVVQKQPNKSYSVNLKPIIKYVNKDGQLIDVMKDHAAFNEKDLENRIGLVVLNRF